MYGKGNITLYLQQDVGGLIELNVRIDNAKLAHNIIMSLIDGLWDGGHCVTMDNSFSNMRLSTTLLALGMYACGIIKEN